MTQTPTDALRLVPVKATPQQLETAAFNLSAEIGAAEAMKLGPHIERAYELLVAAAPASPLPVGGGTSYAAGGLDVLSRIRSRLNEQIERAEADLNGTVTIRLNDAKAIRHLLAPAAPTGEPK